MNRTRAAAGLVSLLAALVVFTGPEQLAQSPSVLRLPTLWVATISQLLGLDPSDGSADLQPAGAANVLRVATDDGDGTLWTYSNGTLTAYDAAGNFLLSSPVPPPASSSVNLALAVDSISGDVWFGVQKNLHHFDDQGQLLGTIALPAQTVDIAFDPVTGRVWVGSQTTVTAYDHNGMAVLSLALGKKPNVTSIAVDRLNGHVWVSLSKSLQLYSATGTLLVQKNTKGLGSIADDGNHGIWASSKGTLLRIGASLQTLVSVSPFGKKGQLGTFTADLSDQSVWVASLKSLMHLGANGATLLSITLPSNVNDVALPKLSPNRDPVAVNDTALTAENTQIVITVLGNDSDPDGDAISITSVSQGAHGGVSHNGNTVTYTPNAGFGGQDSFTYTIGDGKGGSATATVNVTVNKAPVVNAGADQTITLPATANLNGSVTDDGLPTPANLTKSWSKQSGPGNVAFGNANDPITTAVFSQAGTYILRLTGSDGSLTRTDDVQITVNPAGGGLPPDPNTVAPPNDPSTTTTIATSTQFLYTGSNPIQTGVAEGTIDPVRAAVLRGKILDRTGAPISGVTVKILNRPEFGQTLSRADGMFDLAVNGGGSLTVDFQKTGLLPVQRQLNVPWQDFLVLADVVLIGLDPQVTPIALNSANTQVARGSVSSDVDGNRRATLLFTPGTAANIVMPDGSTQPLASMQVRATEYTIGDNGPKSMPAPLPPTSGYTYAVELSADEAIAAGAKSVVFNPPVIKYLENFLNFPVGTIVPVGSYDRQLGAWLPEDNGKVIKIISISGGLANLDTDGDNIVDNGVSLGITDAERLQLATLYSAGQTLWRVPIAHFSPFDCNFPYGPPPDYTNPNQPNPLGNNPEKDPCEKDGSIVECQNQIVGETIRVVGTPYTLNYRSDRVPGRKANFSLTIPLSGNTVPASLRRIDLQISVAGRFFQQSFSPNPNQSFTFTWDGLDAYGRLVQGSQILTGEIHYGYGLVYLQPAQFAQSWAQASSTGVALVSRASKEITSVQRFTRTIGASWDARGIGLGAWTLNIHHAYDPGGQILHRGDGGRVSAQDSRKVINTIAGNGSGCSDPNDPCGDGGPAAAAKIDFPRGLAVASNGDLYIVHTGRIRKVSPDGLIETVAGGGGQPCATRTDPCGDGGPAKQAVLWNPWGVAVGPDGSVFYTDFSLNRVRRVAPNGIITTVAGTGEWCDFVLDACGDGGPATNAKLFAPWGIAVASDGTIYIADSGTRRVRRVTPNGIMSTVAGTGVWCFDPLSSCGDGGPATQAALYEPHGIALGADGSLYIGDPHTSRVRRVTVDGIISTIAGGGLPKIGNGDGGPATRAILGSPDGLTVAPDGSLYIADDFTGYYNGDFRFNRIRRVTADGIISTIAGTGENCFPFGPACGDGGPAGSAKLNLPYAITIGPDGSLYLSDGTFGVRKIGTALPKFSNADIAVVSQVSSELYQFTPTGRHLRTFNTLTGTVRYSFSYDSAGRLISLTDGDGNVTIIERNGAGVATALVAPFGQRTLLASDSNGYLASVTNPAKETTSMVYTADGLLTTFTNPRGFSSHMTYDSVGRLTRDEDAVGGFWALARTENATSFSTTVSSALGRATSYGVENQTTGNQRRVTTFANGTQSEAALKADGTTNIARPDGTMISFTETPDPRWGMESPLIASRKTMTPNGLIRSISEATTATLANPAEPLSLVSLSETLSINGRTYTGNYTGATRAFAFTTPVGRLLTQEVDSQGRPTKFTLAGISPLKAGYDNQGRLSSLTQGDGPDTRTLSLTYNPQGLVASITDPLGRASSYTYDAAGRVTHETLPDNRVVQYSYDANGNLTSVTPPGKAPHSFNYNQIDQISEYIPPNVGAGTNSTIYTYDLDKALSTVTRPDGQQVQYNYDGAGRLSGVVLQPGNVTLETYSYNATTGNLASAVLQGGVNLSYTYDGSLVTTMTWAGPVAGSVGFGYDTDFRINSLSVNGANPVSFAYDGDGFLTQAGNLTLFRDAQNGLLASTVLGNVADSYAYNGFAEVTNYEAKFSGASIFSQQFTRDKLGHITAKTEAVNGSVTTYDYSYDLAGRLAQVKTNNVVTGSYTYDSNGNRLSGPGLGTAPTYDDQDRLLTYAGTTYTYTPNGEASTKTVGGSVTTYHYDVLGHLKSVSLPGGAVIDYLVDGQDRRVGKKVNGSLMRGFLYQDGLSPVAELDGNGNVVSRFVYGTSNQVPDYLIKGGATFRILSDRLGSPRLIVDIATGNIVQQLNYDEFGNVLLDTNPGFQPFGFAGGLYDPDTGLVRFGARDYDAKTGRWTAKDPALFDGVDPNLYGYVLNDPINLIDQDGRKARHAPFSQELFIWDTLDYLDDPQTACEGFGVCKPPNPDDYKLKPKPKKKPKPKPKAPAKLACEDKKPAPAPTKLKPLDENDTHYECSVAGACDPDVDAWRRKQMSEY